MSDAKKGISASQLTRHGGMTYKSAWYVADRIREATREYKTFSWEAPTPPWKSMIGCQACDLCVLAGEQSALSWRIEL
jgi:hypothetical protein